MAKLRPFRALRPTPERVSQVAAVPYDVVNREEAAALARGNPLSLLHVSRPEIDLPADTDPHSAPVYDAARTAFARLREAAPLLVEPAPSLYVYRLRAGEHAQTGIAAAYSVDEYDADGIRKHERTRKDKEDDRTRHILSLRAQTGPVFLAYRGRAEIDRQVADATRAAPLFDFTAPDGVQHALWPIAGAGAEALARAFAEVPALYIADGHHRAASASRARAELRAANREHRGDEDYNFFLAVAFPAEQLRILPYHRVVRDLNGLSPEAFLAAVDERFTRAPGTAELPARGRFGMYLGGAWHALQPRPAIVPPASDATGSLDVSVLQNSLLDPVLGIRDPRTDKRIDFVGGIRGTPELERLVREGRAAVAFALHPTTVDDLMKISDAGQIMPPKSTWFEPKLRDGLLSHLI